MKHSRPELVEIAKTHLSHLSPREQVEWVEHYMSSHPGFHKHATPPEKVVKAAPSEASHITIPAHSYWITIIGILIIIFFLCFLAIRGSKAEPRPHVSINRVTENGSFHLEVDPSFQDIQQIFSFDPSNNLKVNCITGCSASAGFTDNTVFTVGSSTINPLGGYFTSGADPSISTGNSGRIRMDTHSYLFVDCVIGCSGGATTPSDAFANPSTAGLSFDLLAGWNGATWDRLQVDGSKFLKVNCSTGCSGGSTTPSDAFANPTTAGLAFSFNAGWNGTTWDRLKSSTANGLQVDVTRVQGTVTVAGTVNTTPPSNASTNVAQWASQTLGSMANYGTSPGAVLVPGVNAFITNTPAVTLASTTITGTVAATQSGNWTSRIVGNAGAILDAVGQNVAVPPNWLATGCSFFTSPTTLTTGNGSYLNCDPSSNLLTRMNSWLGSTAPTVGSKTSTNSIPVVPASDWVDTVVGNKSNNGAAAGSDRLPTLDCIARTDYSGGTATTAGNNAALDCGTDGLLHVASLPAIRPASFHWSASFAGSSTTLAAHIAGNASNTLLVTKITFSCTQTTAGILTVTVNKTSAASTGGTAATITAVPDDSNYSAAVSVAQSFTGTGPTVGTLVGQIDASKVGCMAPATASPNDIYVLNLRQKPIVLRGVAQTLEIGVGAATTGGNYTVTFEGMEITTITP